ncbi:helix-turn-helix transcriptional regulator [Pantanalinema rosaneae CENA516]|uniref:helix-turn-helix transcriptional regulator n=1 Tax=Pantanalinema rosaneae TaxID=1620701 RepID=UPI003D6DEB14
MAIAFNETDWSEICNTAQLQGENVYQKTTAGSWFHLPHQFGMGGEQIICLHHGLTLSIRKGQLWQDLHLKRQHESAFPLVLKFLLSGCSRVHTANVPSVMGEYEEVDGYYYLYCLPELTEVEQWQAKEPIQMVMIYAHPDYFRQLEQEHTMLPRSLKQLIDAGSIQPFHHNLGQTTPGMVKVLQQIIDCPYQGLVQQLFLEGKALELLALQFAQWEEPQQAANPMISLKPDDIECLHFASKILIQRANNPPSLLELARQVGLNDRKLKQGFLQVFGTTVFGYLQDYRLARSQQLLESGEMSVTEVAHTVGYASLPSFSKAFRKKFGHSPLAYMTRHNTQKVRLG